MRTHRPEPHTLAGAYALDALTGADRARFERHLARCPQCAQEIRGLREATARLAAAAAEQPPAGLTERALAAAARTRQLPPLTRGSRLSWRRAAARRHGWAAPARGRTPGRAWMPRLALALAGAAIILAGILGLTARDAQHQLQQDQQHARIIAAVLTARDATMFSGRVQSGSRRIAVVVGWGVPPVGSMVRPRWSPGLRPEASTGPVMPCCGSGSIPAGWSPPGLISHSS